jgi:hypothetical protein
MEGRSCDVDYEDYIVYGDGSVLCKWCDLLSNGILEHTQHAISKRHERKVKEQQRLVRCELSDRILSRQLQGTKVNI